MSKYAFLGIAAIATAIATAATNYANGTEEPQGAPAEEPKRQRGRPLGSTNKPEDTTGPTVNNEERLAANKLLIKPLIDGGHGELVKKATAVYSSMGIKGLTPEQQPAWEADIKKLSAEKLAGDEY